MSLGRTRIGTIFQSLGKFLVIPAKRPICESSLIRLIMLAITFNIPFQS